MFDSVKVAKQSKRKKGKKFSISIAFSCSRFYDLFLKDELNELFNQTFIACCLFLRFVVRKKSQTEERKLLLNWHFDSCLKVKWLCLSGFISKLIKNFLKRLLLLLNGAKMNIIGFFFGYFGIDVFGLLNCGDGFNGIFFFFARNVRWIFISAFLDFRRDCWNFSQGYFNGFAVVCEQIGLQKENFRGLDFDNGAKINR